MEFGLFGPLLVRSGETALHIPRGKQRAVLAVLLTRAGRVVSVEDLAQLIWDGRPPPSARVSLQNHVKRLRRALGDEGRERIRTSGAGYLIEVSSDELDLARFGVLCTAGRDAMSRRRYDLAATHFAAALALWRGEPYVDISCPALTTLEVAHLKELRLAAQEDRICADLHLGRHRDVIAELQQLAVTARLRERVHALLMLALYRCDRRADALAAYQTARNVLVSELGLEPGGVLRTLHQRVLDGDPSLDLRPTGRRMAASASGWNLPAGPPAARLDARERSR